MAKKKGSRAGRYYHKIKRHAAKKTIPIAVVAGIVGMPSLSNGVAFLFKGDIPSALDNFKGIVGVDYSTGKFNASLLWSNAVPVIAGCLVHKGASMLGVNRYMRNLPSPLNKISV